VLAWIVNGTVLAAFFMSAGPAFYEQLTGDASRYSELLAYLRAVGAQPYSASVMQSYLWSAYVGQSRELGAGMTASFQPDLAKVSVVGVGMRSHTGVAQRMFKALADAKVNIQNITTSEIKISCIISKDDAHRALQIVHEAFELEKAK
jgi:predicted amino acid-binding ACT domain protein